MGTRRTSGRMCTHRMQGMRVMAPAGPDPCMRRPHPVHTLRGWTPARGTDAATTAPHPVRWSHHRRTARRRVHCGGRDRQTRGTAYPGAGRRAHISLPGVPPWWGRDGCLLVANPTPIAKQDAIVRMDGSCRSWAAVRFHGFSSGRQQACPEGPLIGCLPGGDSVKLWGPLSNAVWQCRLLLGRKTRLEGEEWSSV
jgi:hypothetical protein